MIKFEISASAVAWYAAIVATLSAVVAAYNVFRDRARLLIKVMADMKFCPDDTQYGDTPYVIVTVTNIGRRPITVTHVWFEASKRKKPKMLLAGSVKQGAKKLHEGEWADYPGSHDTLDLDAFRYVCVADSTGRVHRRRIARSIRKQLEAEEAEKQGQTANG